MSGDAAALRPFELGHAGTDLRRRLDDGTPIVAERFRLGERL